MAAVRTKPHSAGTEVVERGPARIASKMVPVTSTIDIQPSRLGLSRIKMLEGLEPSVLDRLARQCAWRRFEAGQVLINRDAESHEVFLIVSGRVRVNIYTAAGRQVTFRELHEGDTVGEISAVDGGRRSADVVALSDGLSASLGAADFRQLLRDEPLVTERFMRYLVQLVRLLSDSVIELSTLGVQNRIHAEILRLAQGDSSGGPTRLIAPSPKHADIAARVSTTREQVSRELSALTRSGLLEKHADGMRVTDVERLAVMVQQATMQA